MASMLEPSRQDNAERQKSLLVLKVEEIEKVKRSNFESCLKY